MLKKQNSELNGILIVNKPPGLTSFQVVKKIRSLTKIKKVGHGGTLDPFATGVLPILLGSATKAANHFLAGDKAYLAEMIIGVETDTLDPEGKIIKEEIVEVTRQEIEETFKSFLGKIKQKPPMFSAKKVQGQRLYKLARQGKEVEREERELNIYRLELIDLIKQEFPKAVFEVWCSKGTYVRQLAMDMARKLGTVAYLSKLERIFSKPFHISQALPLQAIEDLIKINQLYTVVIPVEDIMKIIGDDLTW